MVTAYSFLAISKIYNSLSDSTIQKSRKSDAEASIKFYAAFFRRVARVLLATFSDFGLARVC
jgi:hypothetical protein